MSETFPAQGKLTSRPAMIVNSGCVPYFPRRKNSRVDPGPPERHAPFREPRNGDHRGRSRRPRCRSCKCRSGELPCSARVPTATAVRGVGLKVDAHLLATPGLHRAAACTCSAVAVAVAASSCFLQRWRRRPSCRRRPAASCPSFLALLAVALLLAESSDSAATAPIPADVKAPAVSPLNGSHGDSRRWRFSRRDRRTDWIHERLLPRVRDGTPSTVITTAIQYRASIRFSRHLTHVNSVCTHLRLSTLVKEISRVRGCVGVTLAWHSP